jgi:hypothetical protein
LQHHLKLENNILVSIGNVKIVCILVSLKNVSNNSKKELSIMPDSELECASSEVREAARATTENLPPSKTGDLY